MGATLDLHVPDMSCGHCRAAVVAEVGRVPGVRAVEVDLDSKIVSVGGDDLDEAQVREAVGRAGYDIVPRG